ncbi:MAG: division/cell wall cluster transcriptional repressor MraZ [Patescibacteria group bacterium]
MFIGEYTHAIDDKGRVSVPAKFRAKLQEGVVITRGLDHCLFIYPKKEWGTLAEKLSLLPLSQKQSRAFARLMLSGAWDVELDSQGRVMLPASLRAYARLGKQVVITGLYNRLELWDEGAWLAYKQETEERSDDIAESMSALGV